MKRIGGGWAEGAVGTLFALLLLTSCAGTGVSASGLTCSEKMMWSTYALATPKGLASCVVVNRPDSTAPGGTVPVIITAAHVLTAAPHGPFYLVIRQVRPGQNPTVGILQFDAPDPRDRPFYQNPRHDVAALELRVPAEFATTISLPSFINEKDVAAAADDPHAGDDIAVLGFPRVFPGTEGAFPILRAGKIASYSAGTSSDHEKFLINTNVYGGDSGGPVFGGRRGGRPKLVGLVTERIGEKSNTVPLAVAVNASVIRETLQLQSQQDRWYLNEAKSRGVSAKHTSQSGAQLVGPRFSFQKMQKLGHGSLKRSRPSP